MIPFRTFCLTLPENPQRTFKAKEHFESRGLPVEFFNAIHGPTAGLSTIHPYEVDNPGSGFRMGFVPTGIFLAHYNLWMALQLLPDAHFLVLEDDAQFPDDAARSLTIYPPARNRSGWQLRRQSRENPQTSF